MKIGIIGLGDMGKLFAKTWADQGFEIIGCDKEENKEALLEEFQAYTTVRITTSGVEVSRLCDFILYSVETSRIHEVVAAYGPSTKFGAIVAGQTSVKAPEIAAFEKYLPKDVHIITLHSLHGPNVHPVGQKIVQIVHRCTDSTALNQATKIIQAIGSDVIELENYVAHDKMMADIQAITHIGFESIGTAFMHRGVYPWESPTQPNGLDSVKLLMTLRIYSYKHHVYSGLALLNPEAKKDIRVYAQSEHQLFGQMISEQISAFKKEIWEARDIVFKDFSGQLMLEDQWMSEYSLNPTIKHLPNSHLSLLSMVVAWKNLGTNPYKSLICQTPPFRLRVGMAEYLFMNDELLNETLETALFDKSIRQDDLAFHTAVHEWANIIEKGDVGSYQKQFENTRQFLSPRLVEGRELSSQLINRINHASK